MRPVVVLASRSRTSYLLINHLAARFDVAAVVFEKKHRGRFLRHRLRRLGPLRVAAQLAFVLYDRLVIAPRSRAAVDRLLAGHDVRPPDGRLRVLDVASVNGPEVTDLLLGERPSAVVVSGTGIIAGRVLGLAPAFVNIHTGITPRYRGVHGGFWAVCEGRADLAGTTVHLVDPGVDTGGILFQETVSVDPFEDTYRTLPVKQYLAALDAMAEAVRQVTSGRARPYRRSDLGSEQWYTPTLRDHLRFRRAMRTLRGRSGDRSTPEAAPVAQGDPRGPAQNPGPRGRAPYARS
ncbi:formyl transferase [Streptosporangium sp. NPDC048047]|uniref:formyl transferase n=1 Tax=Streptosporangium sp. NPDC048047 TaxID=3155748 RepID=UPI00343228A9